MAPKLSKSMDDPRLPSAGGGTPVPPLPTGVASAMPDGLLPQNGPLAPSGATRTIEGSWPTVGTRK